MGSELVKVLLYRASEEGAKSLDLEVRSTNHGAIALYRRLGFSQFGKRKSYYDSPLEDAVLLRVEIATATSENG